MEEAVECYSGYTHPERPRAFIWQGERFEVVGIIARGRGPSGQTFRVRVSGGEVFDLAYNAAADGWRIQVVPETVP